MKDENVKGKNIYLFVYFEDIEREPKICCSSKGHCLTLQLVIIQRSCF